MRVSPAAAVEFQHYKGTIIEKINSFFGYNCISHVTLKVDGKIVSDSVYQTKSFTELGMVYFGHYWSKEAAFSLTSTSEDFCLFDF